jgi:hypothetical protein
MNKKDDECNHTSYLLSQTTARRNNEHIKYQSDGILGEVAEKKIR